MHHIQCIRRVPQRSLDQFYCGIMAISIHFNHRSFKMTMYNAFVTKMAHDFSFISNNPSRLPNDGNESTTRLAEISTSGNQTSKNCNNWRSVIGWKGNHQNRITKRINIINISTMFDQIFTWLKTIFNIITIIDLNDILFYCRNYRINVDS